MYLVTSADQPDLGADDQLLYQALSRAGVPTRIAVWTDPTVDWTAAGACVLRSVWDYHLHIERFRSWVAHVAEVTTLINPAELVLWNTHKGYLHELADRGIPIIDTVWLSQGAKVDLGEILARRGWRHAIIKPAVSASAWKTTKTQPGDPEGQRFVDGLLTHTDVMVQPYLDTIEREGEIAVVAINGKLTHAARRASALVGDIEVTRHGTEYRLRADEESLATEVLSLLPATPFYARVDIVRDHRGRALLGELELIEPVLYLRHGAEALDRLVTELATYPSAAAPHGRKL
ncbi:RimK family alpha-L-glutamate ligase [Streptomyces sp. NPDC056669]|uniref:ATP-grasp domain-containing protein n=1 Tax=unclassified Streptomyces TaxID=2593676 RepID=UPI00367B4D5A